MIKTASLLVLPCGVAGVIYNVQRQVLNLCVHVCMCVCVCEREREVGVTKTDTEGTGRAYRDHLGLWLTVFGKINSGAINIFWASLVAQAVKNPPAMQETSLQRVGRN